LALAAVALLLAQSSPGVQSLTFTPKDADPGASDRNLPQLARRDASVPARRKLVVVLAGANNPPGPETLVAYAASQGFHVFAVAYKNDVSPVQNDPDFFGNLRLEAFDGLDRTPGVTVARPDCVEVRIAKALAYLQQRDAEGKWSAYLDRDGQVRWSDVIFAGHSHGASSAAVYAKVRRVDRVISFAGPRDTNPVIATWLSMKSATPIDRFYGFTGTDDSQYPDHQKAFDVMGYRGALVNVGDAPPPYGGSHRLAYTGGHGDAIDCARFADACKVLFGID
jgi:hypothetical protein